MKIKATELDTMRVALFETLKAHNLHPFMVANDGHAWEVFHKAWNEGRLDGHALYQRYTDAHITTALRAIFKPVRNSGPHAKA